MFALYNLELISNYTGLLVIQRIPVSEVIGVTIFDHFNPHIQYAKVNHF